MLEALYEGVADEAAALPIAARLQSLQEALATEGWLLPAGNIGDYGTDYAFRALVAVVGLGANTPDEAIYPTGLADGNGALYERRQRLPAHLRARPGAAGQVLLVADDVRLGGLPGPQPGRPSTRSARATRRSSSSRTARS